MLTFVCFTTTKCANELRDSSMAVFYEIPPFLRITFANWTQCCKFMRKSLGTYYSLSEFKTESDFAKFDFPLHEIFLFKPSSSEKMHWGRG